MPAHSPHSPRWLTGAALGGAVLIGSSVIGVGWLGWPHLAPCGATGAPDVDTVNTATTVDTVVTVGDAEDVARTAGVRSDRPRAPANADPGLATGLGAAALAGEPATRDLPDLQAVGHVHRSEAQAPGGRLAGTAQESDAPTGMGAAPSMVLPRLLIELGKETVWDEQATEALEELQLLIFDTDGDFQLDDRERITAVQAMRDAVWPGAAEALQEFINDAAARERGRGGGSASLGPEDLRLHHDVDQSRRLDDAEARESGRHGAAADRDRAHEELRAAVLGRFELVDDGRLAAPELAGYLRRYRAGSEQADLNGDGHADEMDLRLFLDVARPIRTR